MQRTTAGIVMAFMAVMTAAAPSCLAGEGGLEELMRAYRQKVLSARTDAADLNVAATEPAAGTWLQLGWLTVSAAGESEADSAPYTPWPQRRGQAYPGDYWHSFGRDAKELPLTVWDDTKATFTDRTAIIGLLAAGAAGIIINATGVDDAVDRRTDGHRHLSKSLDGIGGFFGSPAVHFPMAGAMYLAGLAGEDTKLYETSKTLLNALIINGVTVQGLKWATRTESPNGDELGWPSGHTSSSFVVATVMYDAYGPWVGVPLLAFAGFVGYERIDARNHDFSDVVSGAIMGIVIAHAVSNNHEMKIFGMDLVPYADPNTGAVGLALSKTW